MPSPRKLSEVSLMIITGIASVLAAMMWLVNAGTMCRSDDAQAAAPGQLRGQDEILFAQRQEAAAHLARQRRPADEAPG